MGVSGSSEEGLLTSIHAPAHKAWTRPAFGFVVVVTTVTFVVLTFYDLSNWLENVILGLAFFGSAALALTFIRWRVRIFERNEALKAEERAAIREAETERQLAEFRATKNAT